MAAPDRRSLSIGRRFSFKSSRNRVRLQVWTLLQKGDRVVEKRLIKRHEEGGDKSWLNCRNCANGIASHRQTKIRAETAL